MEDIEKPSAGLENFHWFTIQTDIQHDIRIPYMNTAKPHTRIKMIKSKAEAETPQENAWGEQSTQNSKRAFALSANEDSDDGDSVGARLKKIKQILISNENLQTEDEKRHPRLKILRTMSRAWRIQLLIFQNKNVNTENHKEKEGTPK